MRYKGSPTPDVQPFINPILEQRARQKSESETSDSCQSPIKQAPPPSFPAPPPAAGAKPKRKMNNIWGSVMVEQTLSKAVGGVGVDIPLKEKAELEQVEDRGEENYDFTLSKHDTRPDPVNYEEDMGDKDSDQDDKTQDITEKETFGKDETKIQERLKRKRKIKDRLGQRPEETNMEDSEDRVSVRDRLGRGDVKDRLGKGGDVKDRLGEKIPIIVEKAEGYVDVTEEDSVEKIVNALVNNLNEPKVKLMCKYIDLLVSSIIFHCRFRGFFFIFCEYY